MTLKKGNKVGEKISFLGVDDGHYAVKIVTESGETFKVPSRAALGKQMIAIGNGSEGMVYQTEGGRVYTVSEFLPTAEDTRFADYPKSDLNLVVVADALRRAGYGGRSVKITTGLPVSSYYLGNGQPNQPLIDAKVANLQKRVTCEDLPLANIVTSTVAAEAVAAYVDHLMDLDGDPVEDYDAIQRFSVGVIDVGGKTTDCAVVRPGMMVDVSRSGSNDIGLLMLEQALGSHLRTALEVDAALSPTLIEGAMTKGKVRLYGKEHDVSEIVEREKKQLADKIMSAVRTKIGSGADLEYVLFVGGGALMLKDQLLTHFPHARVPEQPDFANARGMLKFAKHVVGESA